MGRDRSDRAAIWFGKRVAAYPLVALNRERVNVSLLMHPPVPLTHLGRSAAPDRPLRLLERMRNRLRTRRYSPRTERAYCGWVRRFVLYHERRHPRTMGEAEIAGFLTHLATDRHVSASTQNQALQAILFLYNHVLGQPVGLIHGVERAKRPRRLPVVLSYEEVRSVLSQLSGVPRLCGVLMYGSGLRVSECVALRAKDVDFDRFEITVRAGKGNKDSRVPLPFSLPRGCISSPRQDPGGATTTMRAPSSVP